MSWTRRWSVIGCMALAQLGAIIGYQALLRGEPSRASAEQPQLEPLRSLVQGPEAPAAAIVSPQERASTPPIPVPALPLPPLDPPTILPQNLTKAAQPVQGVDMPAPVVEPGPQVPVSILPVSGKEPPTPMPVGDSSIPLPDNTQASVEPPLAEVCPWSLNVEIIDGRTHLKAQNGKDVKLTVSCEKLDLQTPGGLIRASGGVKLTTDSIEGTCEQMTIAWNQDTVVLDKVRLKCRLEEQGAELHAEQLRIRLSHLVVAADQPR
jgi:hypothetical protein